MSIDQFAKERLLQTQRPVFYRRFQHALAVVAGLLVIGRFHEAIAQEAGVALGPGINSLDRASQGELLLGELNCTACHAATPGELRRLATRQAPNLGADGIVLTPQYLKSFLSDPHGFKPGTLHPDLLHGAVAAQKVEAVEALRHFLISIQERELDTSIGADSFKIERGRQLFHQVGCVACHAPQESAAALETASQDQDDSPVSNQTLAALQKESIPLGDLARRTSVGELARFLMNPQTVRPSGRMPSLNLSESEATVIAMYLLREQASAGDPASNSPRVRGLSYQYFEGGFTGTSEVEASEVQDTGLVDNFITSPIKRSENVGLRFTGFVRAPRDGSYTFHVNSDDGSRLYIGERLIVDNDGDHAPQERSGRIDLKAGEHPIRVLWYNHGGGGELSVDWEGPDLRRQRISSNALSTDQGEPMIPLDAETFAVDPQKAAEGQRLFGSLGCAACHQRGSNRIAFTVQAPTLDQLNPTAPGGCLDTSIKSNAPKFSLSQAQREALRAALSNRAALSENLTPSQVVTHTMAKLNCYACHSRDGVGGPSVERAAYFRIIGNEDLGDEGRIPPHLTKVGDKLRPEWLREVLLNQGAVRPYMGTRMPQFGDVVRPLIDAFEQADSSNRTETVTDLANAKWGRKLVGTDGLSCIACHTFAGRKSLGISAMDLAHVTKRLKKDWFHRYLVDPPSLRPGTRMPSFFPEGKSVRTDILDGDTDQQIEALWAYLSLGNEGGLPPGLIQGQMELVSASEPVIYRNFIQGAGPRAIGVGYPEKANLAFDANELRLAMIWQGPFIDAAMHRIGRGPGFVPPLGYNLVNLPQGPPFAHLPNGNSPWPLEVGKKAGYQMRGYSLDEQMRPTFLYSFGDIQVEDHPEAVPGDIEGYFRRTIHLKSKEPAAQVWFRAWVGQKLETNGDAFVADSRITFRFTLSPDNEPIIRESEGQKELLVPLSLRRGSAEFIEEINW